MRLLLDTHVLIWWDSAPDTLSSRALGLLLDPENEMILSVASLWEMQVKAQLGKLMLRKSLRDLVSAQQAMNRLTLLPVRPEHAYALEDLPAHHKDPFDRMIVAQAKVEGLSVVSHDTVMRLYPVPVLW